jgi:Leucine-rich repeat (LRR) protein
MILSSIYLIKFIEFYLYYLNTYYSPLIRNPMIIRVTKGNHKLFIATHLLIFIQRVSLSTEWRTNSLQNTEIKSLVKSKIISEIIVLIYFFFLGDNTIIYYEIT